MFNATRTPSRTQATKARFVGFLPKAEGAVERPAIPRQVCDVAKKLTRQTSDSQIPTCWGKNVLLGHPLGNTSA